MYLCAWVSAQTQAGSLVAGFISATKDFGVFVRFVGGVSALAPKAFLCDKDASESDGPVVGQSVWAIVQSVDVDKARMVLNLRKSAVDRLLGTGAAASKKRGGSSNIDDAAATRKTKAARGDADAATADARADVPATSLTIGMTVQCRIEPSELAISDASGLDSTLPASKAALMVTLLGVSGRYKARLGLAECCDVCPFTGKVSNAEGFETFKRLAASFSADAAPVFRAKVIAVRTGKLKERAPGSDAPSKQREALVELELSVCMNAYSRFVLLLAHVWFLLRFAHPSSGLAKLALHFPALRCQLDVQRTRLREWCPWFQRRPLM